MNSFTTEELREEDSELKNTILAEVLNYNRRFSGEPRSVSKYFPTVFKFNLYDSLISPIFEAYGWPSKWSLGLIDDPNPMKLRSCPVLTKGITTPFYSLYFVAASIGLTQSVLYRNASLIRHRPYKWGCLISEAQRSTFQAISLSQITV